MAHIVSTAFVPFPKRPIIPLLGVSLCLFFVHVGNIFEIPRASSHSSLSFSKVTDAFS